MDDKKFKQMIRALKNTNELSDAGSQYLINYVTSIKNGLRNNDFYDVDFLYAIILEFATGKITDESFQGVKEELNRIIRDVEFFLPMGTKTPDYERIKAMIIVSDGNIDKEMYSLFDNSFDYQQIMQVIKESIFDEYDKILIHNYALEVCPYCANQTELKREILSFINGFKIELGDRDDYYYNRITEAKKRYGIYPLDEKTLAIIDSSAKKAEESLKSLENTRIRMLEYEKRVKALTDTGREELEKLASTSTQKLREELETARMEIINKLDEYLLELQKMMKANSDQVFNEILKNTQAKLNDIRLMAQTLSTTTTGELLRIQKASEASVDNLKDYVNSEPKLQEILKEAAKSNKIKEVILSSENNKGENTTVVQAGVQIPGYQRLIVPASPDVIIPSTGIKSPLLRAFDEAIPYSKRYDEVMELKEKREKEGEIFHKLTNKIVNDVLEGDWPYLWGPSGCGKSHLIRQVASLVGIDCLDNGKVTNKYEIMAYNGPQGDFRATQAFVALVYGKMLFLDELDNGNADVMVVLNELASGLRSVIENPTKDRFVTFAEGMRVPINPNFRMIAAGNTDCSGANNAYNARAKLDESIQERMTPEEFDYDNKVEKLIFGDYSNWYNLFCSFREACNNYAQQNGHDAVEGMITTADASAIVRYLKHNSKSVEEIISGKFTQTKNVDYLRSISEFIKNKYGIDNVKSNPVKDSRDLDGSRKDCQNTGELSEKILAKCLVYGCNETIKRRK